MADESTRELAEAIAEHLCEQYQKNAPVSAFAYGDEGRGSPDWDGQISLDGEVDLFKLVEIFRYGIPRLATELPELSDQGESKRVLLQWGSRPDISIAYYSISAARERPELGGWLSDYGSWFVNPQCWWELPRTLAPAALTELEGSPLPVEEALEDPLPVEVECPKCGQLSGNSWSQCRGACPIPGSPHYSVREALRRILRPARR